jgi:hypothetical protein
MEAGGVRPGPEPFVRAEVVHSSERTRITRLFLPGRPVIRKEPLGPDAERRARQEVAMLERSPGVAGVTQLTAAPRYPGSVVLEDAGAASLAGMAKPLPVDKPFSRQRIRAAAESGHIRLFPVTRGLTPSNRV